MSNVILFHRVKGTHAEDEAFVGVTAKQFHVLIDCEQDFIYESTEIDDTQKILETSVLPNGVIQYNITPEIFRLTPYLSSSMLGYYEGSKYYVRRLLCEQHKGLFNPKDVASKRKRWRYDR